MQVVLASALLGESIAYQVRSPPLSNTLPFIVGKFSYLKLFCSKSRKIPL